jgi:phosphatidylglycerol:prolipoprotein diacylglycerol transferase
MNPGVLLGALSPPYYGVLLLLGILGSAIFWYRLSRRDDRLMVIYFGALLGAFLGAKVMYVLAEGWRDLAFADWPDRWLTGKSIVGALLGGYAAVELTKRQIGYRQPTGDWFAIIVPVGTAVGRVGCLLHGCCLGAVCSKAAWWTLTDSAGLPRWPAVPLELGFNLAAAGVLWVLRRQGRFPGQHFHLYLIAYGLFRFSHDFWRATPRMTGLLSGYQLGALGLVLLGLWGYRRRSRGGSGSTTAGPGVKEGDAPQRIVLLD